MRLQPVEKRPLGQEGGQAAAAETVEWRSPLGVTMLQPAPPEAPFLAWCRGQAVQLTKCRLGQLTNTGRCVVACEDIAAGEVVVTVPDAAVLMAENTDIEGLLDGGGGGLGY